MDENKASESEAERAHRAAGADDAAARSRQNADQLFRDYLGIHPLELSSRYRRLKTADLKRLRNRLKLGRDRLTTETQMSIKKKTADDHNDNFWELFIDILALPKDGHGIQDRSERDAWLRAPESWNRPIAVLDEVLEERAQGAPEPISVVDDLEPVELYSPPARPLPKRGPSAVSPLLIGIGATIAVAVALVVALLNGVFAGSVSTTAVTSATPSAGASTGAGTAAPAPVASTATVQPVATPAPTTAAKTAPPAAGAKVAVLPASSGPLGSTWLLTLSGFPPGRVTQTITDPRGVPKSAFVTAGSDGSASVIFQTALTDQPGVGKFTFRFDSGSVSVTTVIEVTRPP